jgi:hypothetical protein
MSMSYVETAVLIFVQFDLILVRFHVCACLYVGVGSLSLLL